MTNVDPQRYEINSGLPKCNIAEAFEFLRLLDPSAEGFSFQTVAEGRGRRKDGRLAQPLHGSLARHAPHMSRLSVKFGAAVYITINATDLKGRTAANIIRVRAVWVDLDHGLPKQWTLPPSIIVETSPGRFQALWLVDGLAIDAHAGVLRRLTLCYGGDSGVNTIERVLRLPGFYHQKGTPFRVRIVEASGRRYTAQEIIDAHPPVAVPAAPASGLNRNPPSLDELRDALGYIDPDDRDDWRDVGMALKHEHGDAARELWDSWSMRSGKYDPDEQEKTWPSFKRTNGKLVTAGTIIHMAKQGGWTRPKAPASEDFEDVMSSGTSHDGLALTFSARHEQDLRYVAVWGQWLLWEGVNWKPETTLKAFDLARDLARKEAAKHDKTVAKEMRRRPRSRR